jgi:hypothetical protein
MQRIRATAQLDCPKERAEALLPEFFDARRDRHGSVRVTLSLTLEDLGLPGAIGVAREVEVRIERRRDEENLNDEYGIDWSPAGGGPYPDFHGRMAVWAGETPGASYIELDGSYEPPLGSVVGEVFDAAVGRTIAERTARRFLEEVAAGITALAA